MLPLPQKVDMMVSDLTYFIRKQMEYKDLDLAGINMEFVDFGKLYSETTPSPIVLNDLPPIVTKDDRDALDRLVRTDIEGDSLNIIPSCSCGGESGMLKRYTVCPNCQTVVDSITERPMTSNVWIRSPKGVAPLMNPTFWSILRSAYTVSKFSVMEWVCDPSYRPKNVSKKVCGIIEDKLATTNIRRGYNNFYNNFYATMETLHKLKLIHYKESIQILELINSKGNLAFTEYLPIPNKLVFLTEKTNVHVYADSNMRHALEVVQIVTGINESEKLNVKSMQYRTVKINNCLADYYMLQFGNTLGTKEGIHRKEMFGTRTMWSGRAVIGSIAIAHRYDHIHLPWGYSIGIFKDHLTNKLLRRGMSVPEINSFLTKHIHVYNPIIDALFDELIEETGLDGIPSILQRNPSLARGSAQCFFITKIKKDPGDVTISMSTLVLAAPNADFDGDALNNWIILDRTMYKYLRRLDPHLTVFDINIPRKVSGVTKIQAPCTETMFNYIHHGDIKRLGETQNGEVSH